MPYREENQNLIGVERDTESKIREMQRQLELGKNEALKEFGESRKEFRESVRQALDEMEELSDEAREDLDEVQKRLGRLNYLLAEETFEDLEKLDHHRDSILDEMENAHRHMGDLKREAADRLESSQGRLEEAWDRFVRCLELVRVRLAEAEEKADERFAEEREQLRKRLADAQSDESDGLLTALWEGLKEHKRWIIAFFQSPLEATPNPPEPGYASTHPKSEKGTGG